MMRPNSLAFRLTASAAAVSLVLLVVAGLLLAKLFQDAVERNFDARLQSVLDGLLGNVEIGSDSQVALSGAIADSRFRLPLSGWYWQITPVDGPKEKGLKSESLLEQRLKPTAEQLANRDSNSIAHFYMLDVNGTWWTLEVGQPWRNERAGLKDSDLAEGVRITVSGEPASDPDTKRLKVERLWINGVRYDLYPDRA